MDEFEKIKNDKRYPHNCTTLSAKIKRAVFDPWWLGGFLFRKLSPFIKNDEKFLKWEYFFNMRKFPDLANPKTFNDKMQWMKIHDRNPLYSRAVDKAAAKEYVAEILGTDEHCIPTYGVWNSFDEIDFDSLPDQFVLKTTHDSGGVVIVKNKFTMDKTAARKILERSIRTNYYVKHREWPYKNVQPRILAERFMGNENGEPIMDYKFFCFHGKPRMLFVATDRPKDTRFDFFDENFTHLPICQGHPMADKKIEKPANFDKMIELAKRLSHGLQQVRVDLYNINGKVYFGELTFFHFSANVPFIPDSWDEKIGSWWDLNTQTSDND